MAIVNVDLSEYDALRNHAKELEEQVKELKEQVKGLKNGSKVILRREMVIESVIDGLPYQRYIPEENKYTPEKSRRTIETSESFVGFEDVRLKVEDHMKKEVERSIKNRDDAAASYGKKEAALDADFKIKETELSKKYQEQNETLEKEYKEKNEKLDKKWLDIQNSLEKRVNGCSLGLNHVKEIAERALTALEKSWIRSRKIEAMMHHIINECDKYLNWYG